MIILLDWLLSAYFCIPADPAQNVTSVTVSGIDVDFALSEEGLVILMSTMRVTPNSANTMTVNVVVVGGEKGVINRFGYPFDSLIPSI